MDRYLFTGALGLLIFQVLYLLADLGLLGSYNLRSEVHSEQAPIGRLIQKRQAVKRKALNSLIWEEPENNEQLYRYDSVLTLDDSGAELELEGDIKLNVHENTLVVLEPTQKENRDDLRVRFQRGLLRARAQSQRLSIGSGDWVLEANQGSNLSIRALNGEQLEVEVNEGEVKLQNRETEEVKSFAQGQKLTLDPEEILKEETLDESLSFIEPQVNRIYTHNFPVPVEVRWEGPAKELQVLSPNNSIESKELSEKSSELLFLNHGTYLLTLKNGDQVSPSFTLELKPAPKLKYLHPLPRDRVDIGKGSLFSWFQQPGIHNYEVRIDSEDNKAWKQKSKSAYVEINPPLRGRYLWSVEATDADGYRIPPFYSIPVYFTDSPLEAPKLNAPQKRLPANKPKDGAWLEKLWNLLFPKAHADDLKPQREVIFTWYPVPGADFYIIEISETEDFLDPVVIKKLKGEEYSWSQFDDKKYHWRVAAGQEGGRMGLFSEASEFDVNLIKTLKTSDLAPGVRYVEAPKVEPTPTPTPTPTPPPPKPEPPPEPPKPKVAPPTKYDFAIHGDYLIINQENEDLGNAQFKGIAGLGLSVSKTWWVSQEVWVTDFELQTLTWKADDEEALPFQDEINTFFALLNISKEGSNWGLSLMGIPVAERADLEKVSSETVMAYGFFYSFSIPMDLQMSWHTNFDIHYGNSTGFAGWSNEFRYKISDEKEDSQYMGVNIDLRFGAGGEITSTWSRVGASYGWSW